MSSRKKIFRMMAISLILAGIIRSTIFENYKIPSPSMVPSVMVGEKFFVSKLHYGLKVPLLDYTPFPKYIYVWNTPNIGDAIVFRHKSGKTFLKRIVGKEGDYIKIDGKEVYINGEKLLREKDGKYMIEENRGKKYYVYYDPKFSSNEKLEFEVPKNSYFVLGDNRNDSWDSRYWGFVKLDEIKGKIKR